MTFFELDQILVANQVNRVELTQLEVEDDKKKKEKEAQAFQVRNI